MQLRYREMARPMGMLVPYRMWFDISGELIFACHNAEELVVPLGSYRWIPRAALESLFGPMPQDLGRLWTRWIRILKPGRYTATQ